MCGGGGGGGHAKGQVRPPARGVRGAGGVGGGGGRRGGGGHSIDYPVSPSPGVNAVSQYEESIMYTIYLY